MMPDAYREKLHVSTIVLIVAIWLASLTIIGQVRPALASNWEEIPQTHSRQLSIVSTPGVDPGETVPMPDRMLLV